jgi:hypothetical protein
MGLAGAVGLEIPHVALVPLRGIMPGVRIIRRIEMAAGPLCHRATSNRHIYECGNHVYRV